MYARALHKLHNSGHENVLAVANGVYFKLLTRNVFINKHGLVFVNFYRRAQVSAQLFFVRHYLHGSAA